MRPSLALFFVASLSGCAHTQGVRYVYQDRDFTGGPAPRSRKAMPGPQR
jgi:hypothetical protein